MVPENRLVRVSVHTAPIEKTYQCWYGIQSLAVKFSFAIFLWFDGLNKNPFVSWTPTATYCVNSKAAVISYAEKKNGDFSDPWKLCTVTLVKELKILICMFPI